jgi:hypothetical protein
LAELQPTLIIINPTPINRRIIARTSPILAPYQPAAHVGSTGTNGGLHVTGRHHPDQLFELAFASPKGWVFQLDLSNPSRLILARNFEMRPDDIVYVSTQPLTEFNTIAGQLISTFTGLLDTTRKIEGI